MSFSQARDLIVDAFRGPVFKTVGSYLGNQGAYLQLFPSHNVISDGCRKTEISIDEHLASIGRGFPRGVEGLGPRSSQAHRPDIFR